jgi:hypothetical protein
LRGGTALASGVHVGALLTPRTNALFHNLQMVQSSARQTGVFAKRAAVTDFIRFSAIPCLPVSERCAAATENGRWEEEDGRWEGLMATGKWHLCWRQTGLGRPRRLWGIPIKHTPPDGTFRDLPLSRIIHRSDAGAPACCGLAQLGWSKPAKCRRSDLPAFRAGYEISEADASRFTFHVSSVVRSNTRPLWQYWRGWTAEGGRFTPPR